MDFKCMKVRKSRGSPYNDAEGNAVVKTAWEVYFEPVETQGDIDGGIASLRLAFWRSCDLIEGQIYDVDYSAKPVVFKLVREA